MKQAIALVVLAAVLGPLFAAADKDTKAEPLPPATVVVTGKMESHVTSSIGIAIEGKTISINVVSFVVRMSDKTFLVAVLGHKPGSTPEEIEEANQKANDLIDDAKDTPTLALEGRLTRVSDKINTGGIHYDNEGILTLKDDKQVILVIDSITVIDDKNRDRFPPSGKACVQGKAVCGQRDLKLFEEPTLAVWNDQLPIILDGDKARADAAGKGVIRASGSLTVDKKGLVRLLADDVKDVKK